MKAIVLDLDGTICDLYGVNGWLPMLENSNVAPHLIAQPLGDYKKLNGLLAALQGYGYAVEVVSWLAKGETTKQFDSAVRKNKRAWLRKYYPAINLNNVHVVKYGTNKWRVSNYKGGILFDDESSNVHAWQRDTMNGKAIRIKDETTLLDALESLIIQELEQSQGNGNVPLMFHVTRKAILKYHLDDYNYRNDNRYFTWGLYVREIELVEQIRAHLAPFSFPPKVHSWRRFYHNTQPKAREKLEKFFIF